MKKSELRQMIREMLREELSRTNLKESLWTCWFDDKEVGTVSAATEEEAVEKMMQEYPEYPYGLYDGCFGVELAENIKEAAFSGTVASDNSFSGGTVRGIGASTQPNKKNYLGRLKSKNPDLVDVITIKGKDVKPGMITQAGEVKTAEVKYSNHYGKDMVYIMHTNDWDGFYDVDGDMEVMADPDDKSKPYAGGYQELKKRGLQESLTEDNIFEGLF